MVTSGTVRRRGKMGDSLPAKGNRVARPPKELTKEQLRTFRGRHVTHLKAIMAERGLTSQQLADMAGIGEPSVRKWFRLEATPEPETLERLAASLGMDDYRQLYPPPATKRKRS